MKKRSAKKTSRRFPILFSDAGLDDARALPKGDRNALRAEMLERLAVDPVEHSKALAGPLEGLRSFRWRTYRVVFKISEDGRAIAVLGIGKHSEEHRKDIYRRLEALVSKTKQLEKVLATLQGFSKPPRSD